MPVVTERVLEYAREQFRDTVQAVLDDPHGVAGYDSHKTAIYYILQEYRQLAIDLGMDFTDLVQELGTKYEIERLDQLEMENNPNR